MDRRRLGRALGYGTRHAAKTLAAVAEAAAAPSPEEAEHAEEPAMRPMPARRRVRPAAAQMRGAGRSVWGPLAAFSGALWLRVTGLFFALIALAMSNGAWRLRGAWRGGSEAETHFWVFAGFGMLFGYFAVSGFVRASLRERRGAVARVR